MLSYAEIVRLALKVNDVESLQAFADALGVAMYKEYKHHYSYYTVSIWNDDIYPDVVPLLYVEVIRDKSGKLEVNQRIIAPKGDWFSYFLEREL